MPLVSIKAGAADGPSPVTLRAERDARRTPANETFRPPRRGGPDSHAVEPVWRYPASMRIACNLRISTEPMMSPGSRIPRSGPIS